MKKPTIVYLGTAIMLIATARLAWVAAHLERNPKYFIGNWQVVGLCAAFAAAFYLKPMIMRWIVGPYFILSALGTIAYLTQSNFSLLLLLNLGLAGFTGYVGIKLFTLKAEETKEPNQSPEPMPMAVTPPAAQEPREP